ncbi:MAG: protein-L-isoaspartate(D-aspartate) O-methyltransferase [archaeon]
MNKRELLLSLESQGISKSVLKSFNRVKRESFVLPNMKPHAYLNTALPIGYGQTISQPYTIAIMLDLLQPKRNQNLLEIGSGCGYVLALLSEIVGKKASVFGVERIKALADTSKKTLKQHKNIKIYNKDGNNGLKLKSPFDRILISAAIKHVPEEILNQLKLNGLLVAPVGYYGESQDLHVIQRKKQKFEVIKKIPGFVFVPFV